MNPKTSHKIIAAGSMAAAIAIGVAMFAMRSHPAASAPETVPLPPPVAQTSMASPDDAASAPTASGAVAALSEAPAAPARSDNVGTVAGFESTAPTLKPKQGRSQDGTDAGARGDRTAETVAQRVERLRSTDVAAARLTLDNSPAVDPVAGMSAALPASDSQITTDVKTAIAGDLAVKDLEIGVSTTDGVVALTGKVASQGAIDQVKDVAAKVKDVKSVDTSALILASL